MLDRANISNAVRELKKILERRFGNKIAIYIFGSVARNNYQPDSDIDVLVLFPGRVSSGIEEETMEMAYELELKHQVVFGIVVFSKHFWNSPKARVMPFYKNVQQDAIQQ